MLTFPHPSLNFHSHVSPSISFSSGFLQNSNLYLKQPIFPTLKSNKNRVIFTCSAVSETRRYEKRPVLKWNVIYKKICAMEGEDMCSDQVLNQAENEEKFLTKWELNRIVKELRKFRRYRNALEVHEWMNNRAEKYRITTSDTAIQLDLIAKVNGISNAEQYFLELPDPLKDKRIYGALLNAYARARMREKTESLMNEMRNKGYATHALSLNVMMTFYMNLKEYEKIESLILEMKEKNIDLDIYSYNIWMSSCGFQGSVKKMERVFEQMELDKSINPNWTTFSTMATMYVKLQHFEKAEECLRNIENNLMGRDRVPYHYLISLYASTGNRGEVYRIWNLYKGSFVNISNLGYHTVISALVRLDDTEGAEKLYDEWLSVKTLYDPRVGNLLLGSYVKKGHSQKAETFFDQMIKMGGKPNSMTWEFLGENHIGNGKVPEALSCFENAVLSLGSKNWRPRPVNVCSILKICEQESDVASRDALLEIMSTVGCFADVSYMSHIPVSGGGTFTGGTPQVENVTIIDGENGGDFALVGQLEESL